MNNKNLYANCAWDSLGIPAILRAGAHFQVRINDETELIGCTIERGTLQADNQLVIHISLPFRSWYETWFIPERR